MVAMSGFPFMKLFPADYFADTRGLTTEQHGAYLLLLLAMWNAEGELPNDDAKLATFTGLTRAKWLKHKPDVLRFFRVAGDTLRHKRIDEDLNEARELSGKRSAAGRASGEARAAAHEPVRPIEKKCVNSKNPERDFGAKSLESNGQGATHVPQLRIQNTEIINYQPVSVAARTTDPPPFPSDGAINYSQPFADVARRHGRGADINLLAEAFRKFCRAADIPFDDRQIVRKFETFCGKHKLGRLAA
jgi:uncharacterized protein YdaU (DUF1376 family)